MKPLCVENNYAGIAFHGVRILLRYAVLLFSCTLLMPLFLFGWRTLTTETHNNSTTHTALCVLQRAVQGSPPHPRLTVPASLLAPSKTLATTKTPLYATNPAALTAPMPAEAQPSVPSRIPSPAPSQTLRLTTLVLCPLLSQTL